MKANQAGKGPKIYLAIISKRNEYVNTKSPVIKCYHLFSSFFSFIAELLNYLIITLAS